MMSPQYMATAVHAFNALPRHPYIHPNPNPTAPQTPNHWHISIRRISASPPLHTVFLYQPTLQHCACQGRIEKGLGGPPGQAFDLTSPAATTVIARLVLDQFVGQRPSLGRPWSWATDDEALGRRLVDVMQRLGVSPCLLWMPGAGPEENAAEEGGWAVVAREVQFLVSDW